MSVIHSFMDADISKAGVWIRSVKDGPEIMLDCKQARQLAADLAAQGFSPRPVAQPVTQQRKAAPVAKPTSSVQRKSTDISGTIQSVGKSSFQRDDMKEYTQDLAKGRALRKLENELDQLRKQGKTWNRCKTTTRIIQNGYSISCVAQATLS